MLSGLLYPLFEVVSYISRDGKERPMKVPRILPLLIFAAICGMPHAAFGDPVDFHMGVLDPSFPILPTTDIRNTSPFPVTFGGCPSFIPATGCFEALNDTGQTITSLTLTFANSTNPNPTDPDVLNGQPADCDTTPVFVGSSTVCGLNGNGVYDLLFLGGNGLAPGTFFILYETGPNPDAFGTGSGVVGLSPEPDSLLLFSTGAMIAAFFVFRRKLFVSGPK
jgi:hypothetical protein